MHKLDGLAKDKKVISFLSSETPPRGFAKLLLDMNRQERKNTIAQLEDDFLAELLFELPVGIRITIIRDLKISKLAKIITHLRDDKAVNLLQELPTKKAVRVFLKLPDEKKAELNKLLKFPHNTAGGLMTSEIRTFGKNETVGHVLKQLKGSRLPDAIYILDKGRFFGEVKTKDLLFVNKKKKMKDIANRDVLEIAPEIDQEEVVKIFVEKDATCLPVVDSRGVLLGAITIDAVIDAYRLEVNEDLSKLAGIENLEEAAYAPVFDSVKARVPWLLFTVFGEIILTGNIIRHFDGLLSQYISLSFFLPVLMCLSGDSSIQSSIVAIKGIMNEEIKNVRNFLLRDIKVGLVVGGLLGLLSAALSLVWLNSWRIGAIVGISITVSLMMANVVGTMLPIIFDRAGMDPSVSTGPLLTTTMDVISMSVYFITASLLLTAFF